MTHFQWIGSQDMNKCKRRGGEESVDILLAAPALSKE